MSSAKYQPSCLCHKVTHCWKPKMVAVPQYLLVLWVNMTYTVRAQNEFHKTSEQYHWLWSFHPSHLKVLYLQPVRRAWIKHVICLTATNPLRTAIFNHDCWQNKHEIFIQHHIICWTKAEFYQWLAKKTWLWPRKYKKSIFGSLAAQMRQPMPRITIKSLI